MTDHRVTHDLPPDVSQYISGMRRLDRPEELVDSIMAEVEATPQEVRRPPAITAAMVAAAVAASLLAVALLLRFGPPPIGPTQTPIPLADLPSAGAVLDRISTEVGDEPAASGLGYVWFSNAALGEVVRMDPATDAITTPIPLTAPQPGGVLPLAAGVTSVWAFDNSRGELVEIDPGTQEELRRLPVAQQVVAIAVDGNAVWLADAGADQVVRIDPVSGEPNARLDLMRPEALLIDGDRVWVAYGGRLARLDGSSGAVLDDMELAHGATRLVRAGDLVLALGDDGVVRGVSPSGMRVRVIGPRILSLATADGRVWATTSSQYVVELDPQTLWAAASLAVDVDIHGGLLSAEGALWTVGTDATGDAFVVKVQPAP